MPGYVSHTIMSRDVYDKLKIKNVDIDYMVTYSLGGDLCKYSKCRKDSHKIKLDEFIYGMADYIIDNNLFNNKKIMGVLYGHVCHMVMDKVIHPYVYKIDKKCIYIGVKNHTLIEGYLDNYLVRYKYNIMIDKYLDNKLLVGDIDSNIGKMIDYVYRDVYDTKRVSLYYRYNLFLYRMVRFLYKVFGIGLLIKMFRYDKFKDINIDRFKYMEDSIRNKEDVNEFIELYNKSIDISLEYIYKINKYMGIN